MPSKCHCVNTANAVWILTNSKQDCQPFVQIQNGKDKNNHQWQVHGETATLRRQQVIELLRYRV